MKEFEKAFEEQNIKYIKDENKYIFETFKDVMKALQILMDRHISYSIGGSNNKKQVIIFDSVIKKQLNPKIWNPDNSLKPEIKDQIEKVVQKFKDYLANLKIDIDINDVILVGSNASYNYNSKSDLDIHIIVPEADENILKLYDSYKTLFNKTYKIKFNKIPVELYVQNDLEKLRSKAIYSINKGWIKKVDKEQIEKVDISSDLEPLLDEYKQILENKDIEQIKSFIDKLYELRQEGLSESGDFSKGNLIFKEFRTKGYLKKLKDLEVKLETKSLSIGDVIKEENGGYVIYSEKGKKLSKIYKNKKDAEERLKEIEMFKHMKDEHYGELPLKQFEKVANVPLWNSLEENTVTKKVDKLLDFGWNFYKDYLSFALEDMFDEVQRIKQYNASAKEFAEKGLGSANTQRYGNLFELIEAFKELKHLLRDELIEIKQYKPWACKPSFRNYLLEIYNIIGGQRYMKDSKKDIVEQGFDEYIKCLEKSEEGKFEYSEKLIEFLHKIEELADMSEQEILGMFEEMKERKAVLKDEKSITPYRFIKIAKPGMKVKVMSFEGNWEGKVKEVKDEKVIIVDENNEEHTFSKDDTGGYFIILDSHIKDADEESISEAEYEALIRHAAHGELLDMYEVSSQKAQQIFERVCKEFNLPEDPEWIIAPEILENDGIMNELYKELRKEVIAELNNNEFAFDTSYDKRYGEHGGTERIMDIFNIRKHTTFDAFKYVYQFPADMTQEDIKKCKEYKLEYLGKVNENGFQPGDHLVKGKLGDLKRYCEEWIGGYVMHPDYLYKENDIDLEDILDEEVKDSNVELKTYAIYSDKDEGPFKDEIENVLEQCGLKIKKVKEEGDNSFLVLFDAKEEDMFKIAKKLDLPYESGSEFEYKEEVEDKFDSNKLMDLINKCKEVLKRGLIEEGYDDDDEIFEKAEFEVRHEKKGEKDIIVAHGSQEWVNSDFEEEIINDIKDEITNEYPEAEFKWYNNSAGGYWII